MVYWRLMGSAKQLSWSSCNQCEKKDSTGAEKL